MTKTAVAQAEDRRIAHQPALDGLRAVAVSAVLLYHHVGHNGGIGQGGFLGVDIFFVISGFLITALLLAEHRGSGAIDLRRFWSRRARRLIPALLAMLVLAAFLSRLVYPETLQPMIHQDVLWTVGYLQNWHIAFFHAQPSPIGHTWSLSVEEQWYLLWPAALWVLLIWTRGRTRRLAWVLAGLAGASALLVAYLYANGRGDHAFFGTDARALELLVGAGLAAIAQSVARTNPAAARRRTVDGAGLVALAALVLAMVVATAGPTWGKGPLLAMSVATALVIAAGVQPTGPVRTILSFAPLGVDPRSWTRVGVIQAARLAA